MVSPQGTLSLEHMSIKEVAVIPEIGPGETSTSYISGNSMYQDGAPACHVWRWGGRPAAVTESSSGESKGFEMRVLGVADGDDVGADLVVPRAAEHGPARQDMAWTAVVASASTGRALTVSVLRRPAGYPYEPGSVG
jgi:hypothetical protein